jgi:hypothetical protein
LQAEEHQTQPGHQHQVRLPNNTALLLWRP